tara:strand:+ start:4861 stop:5247 length:387 start_codon:yes stop_codon:yes gene_type:complete
MKILCKWLLFFSLGFSDKIIFEIDYHDNKIDIKKITYYNIKQNKIELSRIELYWVNGQKYSETFYVMGLKYKEMLWYENGQKGMECKEVDARGVNCKFWKKDGTATKEEDLNNIEENELFLEFRNRYF